MTESALKLLTRQFNGAVIPPFQRESLLRFIIPEPIGDEGVITWAKRILKKTALPSMKAYGGSWKPSEDIFDLTKIDLIPYDCGKRIRMNTPQVAAFKKNKVFPAGFDEIGSRMAEKSNNLLFLGKDTSKGDQYNHTNNQFITKATNTSTDYADPTIITEASGGVWDVFGEAQQDAARLVGNLGAKGYNPATSLLFYPEITEPVFRRPKINAANHYGDGSILSTFLQQGILGSVPIKDTLLKTAGGATPTVEAFDIYLVDMAQLIAGYSIPENTKVIYDPLSRDTVLDTQLAFVPLFIPRKFDDSNEYVYKGVSRMTACDANT